MARRRRKPAKKHTDLLKLARPHYETMLAAQNGQCAICPRFPTARRRLDIDHDHRSMQIRGLLCSRCNRAIPHWMDAEWCDSAAEYLRRDPVILL